LEIKGKSLEELCNQKKKVWRKLKRFRKWSNGCALL
jgi:hypothetical protein